MSNGCSNDERKRRKKMANIDGKSFVAQWEVIVGGKVSCFALMMDAVRYAANNGGTVKAVWDRR